MTNFTVQDSEQRSGRTQNRDSLSSSPLAAIEVSRVSKRFGSHLVLADVSLTVPQGQIVALLGPNGAGKTTFISLLLGQRPADPVDGVRGIVRLLGEDPRLPATRALVGAMLQDSDVPGQLTVRETVELFRAMYPSPLPVEDVLALSDLGAAAHKRTAQLSGGQRRRLVFALSIVGDPRLLFLDEPTTAMDPASRALFWAAIEDMKRRGRTILLTTHHLEEAEQVADRVVVLGGGRLIADGSPEALRSQVGSSRVSFDSDITPAQLSLLTGSDPVTQTDTGRYTVQTAAPEALLARLFAASWKVERLEVNRASLEDAFMRLIRPEHQA